MSFPGALAPIRRRRGWRSSSTACARPTRRGGSLRAAATLRRAPARRARLHAPLPPLQHRPAHLRQRPAAGGAARARWWRSGRWRSRRSCSSATRWAASSRAAPATTARPTGALDRAVRHVFCLGTPHLGAPLEKARQRARLGARPAARDARAGAGPQRPQRRASRTCASAPASRRTGATATPTSSSATAAGRSRSCRARPTTSSAPRSPAAPTAPWAWPSGTCSCASPAPRGRGRRRRIPFAAEHGAHLGGLTHFDLLNHPQVYERIRSWLGSGAPAAALAAGG